jgi:RNA polymerase sigma-70 factor, ECF subfamily
MQAAAQVAANLGGSDALIARRIAGGDRDALRQLMRRHNQALFRVARSILKDDAEAEDAVQEAYLLAYGALGEFRGEAKLSTWLTRITVNESIARARKRKRGAEVIQLGADTPAGIAATAAHSDRHAPEQPEQDALRAETRRLLERNIGALPDAFRTVFVMRALEEMSVDETAAVLGIPVSTVRTRFFRARGMLRESLARDIDFAFEDAFSFAGERCDRIVAAVLARLAVAAPGI